MLDTTYKRSTQFMYFTHMSLCVCYYTVFADASHIRIYVTYIYKYIYVCMCSTVIDSE